MLQRRMDELRAMARERGIEPVGDRRLRHTWELALGELPILVAIKAIENIPGVDRVQEPNRKNISGVDRVQESNRKNISGVDRVQEPNRKNISGVDRIQEPIELATENIFGVDRAQELIEDFTCSEPELTKLCPCSAMPALQCDGTTAYHIFSDRIVFVPCYKHQHYKLMLARSYLGAEPKNIIGVDRIQEPIELAVENILGVGTVETVLLESMCQWAPCELLLTTASIVETFCPCGEVLASQCDGRTVVFRVYPDRIVRVPCYKNRVGCCSRSPPGGDAMT